MPQEAVSPLRLVGTLATAGAVAGFALVFVYGATQPRIQRNKAEALKRAIHEVLHDPARYETVHEGEVYLGFDEKGRKVGYAIVAAEPGFQDTVKVIFGYDAAKRKLLGMRVIESKETPGLGDKIEKDVEFVKQFEGPDVPLAGVRAGTKAAPNEIDMITGATISCRAVIRIINNALERWGPLLEEQ